MFEYSKYYSGKEPEFVEGDVFRIIVPLNESFSYDFDDNMQQKKIDKVPMTADKLPTKCDVLIRNDGVEFVTEAHEKRSLSKQHRIIMEYALKSGMITSKKVVELLAVKQRRARDIFGELVEMNMLEKQGSYKSTVYIPKTKVV